MKTTNISLVIALSLLLGFTSVALAGKDKEWPKTVGEIVHVDPVDSIFRINDPNGQAMTFKATPKTDIEIEGKGLLAWDKDAALDDLAPGQWVKVKYFGTAEIKIAKEIKMYEVKGR